MRVAFDVQASGSRSAPRACAHSWRVRCGLRAGRLVGTGRPAIERVSVECVGGQRCPGWAGSRVESGLAGRGSSGPARRATVIVAGRTQRVRLEALGERVPGGRRVGLVLAPGRARRRVFRVAGTGARWVGGRAPSTLLLFPCLVGAAGASAAALGPGLPVVCLPRCLPSLARAAGHAGRVGVAGLELGCPLDDQLASRPGWVGIVLHPYTAQNSARRAGQGRKGPDGTARVRRTGGTEPRGRETGGGAAGRGCGRARRSWRWERIGSSRGMAEKAAGQSSGPYPVPRSQWCNSTSTSRRVSSWDAGKRAESRIRTGNALAGGPGVPAPVDHADQPGAAGAGAPAARPRRWGSAGRDAGASPDVTSDPLRRTPPSIKLYFRLV